VAGSLGILSEVEVQTDALPLSASPVHHGRLCLWRRLPRHNIK